MSSIKARYTISTSVNEETKDRLQKVRRDGGYTVPEVLKMGIEVAEKEIRESH